MEPGPSILNMAEAMLQNNEYKTSHTSLNDFADESDNKDTVKGDVDSAADNSTIEKRNDEEEKPPLREKSTGDKKSEGRSVVIQVPPKRRKISTPFTPKEVVDALNTSMSMEERLDSIYKALSAFDHDDTEIHNVEIQSRVDIALVKMLTFLEFKTGFRRPPIATNLDAITKEISLACQALEMVYRASSEAVEISFNRVGTDLMQIIVILIDEEVKARMQRFTSESPASAASAPPPHTTSLNETDDEESLQQMRQRSVTPPPYSNAWGVGDWDRDMMLRKASKILGHFARVGSATRAIAHFPGLLGSILNLINMRPYDAVPWEARLSCLWTIANLACNTDNMMMMICTPGLVNSLVNVGFRQVELSEPLEKIMEILRARSIASRAILNLSWPPENKILLAENAALISMLSQLAVKRRPPYSRSKTMIDILAQTRRYAVSGLRNLAAAPRRSKIALCENSNGKILDILTDVALHDDDESIVELAFAAIHNLAIHDTAEVMVSKPDLILALKNHLVTERGHVDGSSHPKSHASSTLLVLERSITPDMDCYENLRELIDAINPVDTIEERSSAESDGAGVVEV